MTAPAGHGALAALPGSAPLVAARRALDDPASTRDARIEAARLMLATGNVFDQGRARSTLRRLEVTP